MSEWFKDWFDTKYYHILYKKHDFNEAERFIEALMGHLSISPSAKVLDLACGKGRHSVFLNKLGLEVLGVDLSKENILAAQEFANERLNFKQHDMRDPLEGHQFDVVFNLFTSFGYFEDENDNHQVFKAMQSYLKKEGLLVIDFFNANYVKKHLVASQDITLENINFRIQKSIKGGFIHKHIHFEDEGRTYDFKEKVQLLELSDFDQLLTKNQFEVKEVFGDYNLSTFDPLKSERLIIIAQLR